MANKGSSSGGGGMGLFRFKAAGNKVVSDKQQQRDRLQQVHQEQLAALKEKARKDEDERQRSAQAELDELEDELRAVADVVAQRIQETTGQPSSHGNSNALGS